MSAELDTRVLWVECPTCGIKGPAPDVLSDWDGETYLFSCGHRHHLDERIGGARTWIVADGGGEEADRG